MVEFKRLEDAVNNLFANWIEDEESCYLEDLDNMLQENKFKTCKYHLDLNNNKISLSDIPTDKLCDGYNYTDLRILEDYIIEKRGEENIKDILWEYIAEKDIPEIEKRLTKKEGENE